MILGFLFVCSFLIACFFCCCLGGGRVLFSFYFSEISLGPWNDLFPFNISRAILVARTQILKNDIS